MKGYVIPFKSVIKELIITGTTGFIETIEVQFEDTKFYTLSEIAESEALIKFNRQSSVGFILLIIYYLYSNYLLKLEIYI